MSTAAGDPKGLIDLYVASHLATQTLERRDLNTTPRRFVLTGALAPWAWIVAGLWPFLRGLGKRMDWDEDTLGAALGAIAHVAYHLGTVRQRLQSAGILRT